jgi:hypothetical protein
MTDTAARDNATAWLTTIRRLVATLNAAYDADACDGAQDAIDAAQWAIQRVPLAVEVRSGWDDPVRVATSIEYRILCPYGGTAARITGALDGYALPAGTARLEYQDWGTPWTPHPLTDDEADDVLTFARQFNFGE